MEGKMCPNCGHKMSHVPVQRDCEDGKCSVAFKWVCYNCGEIEE